MEDGDLSFNAEMYKDPEITFAQVAKWTRLGKMSKPENSKPNNFPWFVRLDTLETSFDYEEAAAQHAQITDAKQVSVRLIQRILFFCLLSLLKLKEQETSGRVFLNQSVARRTGC